MAWGSKTWKIALAPFETNQCIFSEKAFYIDWSTYWSGKMLVKNIFWKFNLLDEITHLPTEFGWNYLVLRPRCWCWSQDVKWRSKERPSQRIERPRSCGSKGPERAWAGEPSRGWTCAGRSASWWTCAWWGQGGLWSQHQLQCKGGECSRWRYRPKCPKLAHCPYHWPCLTVHSFWFLN